MASTTKIMTAVVVLDHVPADQLDVPFTVGAMRSRPGETVMGLRSGDQVTVRELLYGLLLPSGNDAADALALRVAGSRQRFVDRMNATASVLGLTHTRFANPSGLDDPGHYSTAKDLAVLAAHAMRYRDFAQIVGERTHDVGESSGAGGRSVVNLNAPLFYYPGVTGVKPGWTPNAGVSQVVSVTLDGRSVIAVLLDTDPAAADMTRLLDWLYGTTSHIVPGNHALSRVRGIGSEGEPWTYYPATAQRVRAGFLDYFHRVGGIDVLGYPISEERSESGRVVQYFQRARLEWHPEHAGTRYEVQLSLLGERLAASRGLLPQPTVAPFESWASSRYFPETGHGVHTAFLRFFDRIGGADVLGYPITEELPSDADWPHAVQYFQRGRLQYHPERAGTPGEVTASLLGEWAMSHQPAVPSPRATPTAQPSPTRVPAAPAAPAAALTATPASTPTAPAAHPAGGQTHATPQRTSAPTASPAATHTGQAGSVDGWASAESGPASAVTQALRTLLRRVFLAE